MKIISYTHYVVTYWGCGRKYYMGLFEIWHSYKRWKNFEMYRLRFDKVISM